MLPSVSKIESSGRCFVFTFYMWISLNMVLSPLEIFFFNLFPRTMQVSFKKIITNKKKKKEALGFLRQYCDFDLYKVGCCTFLFCFCWRKVTFNIKYYVWVPKQNLKYFSMNLSSSSTWDGFDRWAWDLLPIVKYVRVPEISGSSTLKPKSLCHSFQTHCS